MATEIMQMAGFARDTPVVLGEFRDAVGVSVNDVLKWVEPNAPPQEALKFLLACRAFGLNPFAGEAYLVQLGGKWTTIVGKYGYLKRAQRHPDYDGYEAGIVAQEQERDARGNPVPGKTRGPLVEFEGNILPSGHLLLGGWARVWRKGVSRPVRTRVSLAEYDRGVGPWKSHKCTMIVKTALSHGLREAFAFGEAYDVTDFEPVERRPTPDGRPGPMPRMVPSPTSIAGPDGSPGGDPAREALYADNPDPICPPSLVEAIEAVRVKLGADPRWLESILMRRGYASVSAMSPVDASMILTKLEGFSSRADFLEAYPDAAGPANQGPSAAHAGAMPLDMEIVGAGVAEGPAVPDGEPED